MRNAARAAAANGYRPQVGRSKRIDPNWAGPDVKDVAKLMLEHSNFASIGAIGPDLFFFLPDFRNVKGIPLSSFLVKVLNFLEDFYRKDLDPYITKYQHYLGPIGEDTAEEMSRLTGGLSESVGNITGELSSILIHALENWLTSQKDWWEYFSLGLNKGPDDQDYMWSDIFHYRSTGDFPRQLWLNANKSGKDGLRAYSLGFVTHVATDVTGHPFVNEVTGGPFRMHWQRHHLIENHMDAFWYLTDQDDDAPIKRSGYDQFTSGALYYDIAFDDTGGVIERPNAPTGRTLRERWTRKRMLDQDSQMPQELADLLEKTIEDVFYSGKVPHPRILATNDGRPDAEMIRNAYDLFYRFMKLTTVDGLKHEPPEPPLVFPNLHFPTPTDPNKDSGGGDGGGGGGGGHHHSFWDDLLDFVLAVARAIAYVAQVVAYLITLIPAIIADLATYPLRYILYWVLELPLYHMLKNFRAVLVLTGYAMPMKDEIAPSLMSIGTGADLTFDQIKAQMGDVFGSLHPPMAGALADRFVDPNYPRRHPSDEFRHPWNYPNSQPAELGYENLGEVGAAPRLGVAGPYASGTTPSVFFAGDEGSPDLRAHFESATTPEHTSSAVQGINPNNHMGDSVSFCKYLIWLTTRDAIDGNKRPQNVPYTNWNLDADRGYAYHDWDWNRDPDPKHTTPDEQGHIYQNPCVWPSQADLPNKPAPADTPVQIHYVSEPDPHCQPFPKQPPPPPPLR
ncbi:MAG: hypothetical protein NVSMB5_15250 [Candidatus Velthaea sp.]